MTSMGFESRPLWQVDQDNTQEDAQVIKQIVQEHLQDDSIIPVAIIKARPRFSKILTNDFGLICMPLVAVFTWHLLGFAWQAEKNEETQLDYTALEDVGLNAEKALIIINYFNKHLGDLGSLKTFSILALSRPFSSLFPIFEG